MIHTYIPYAPKEHEGNLGWAYNNFMEMVGEDDWVCFLDHDATFTTLYWYHQIETIIKENPDIGAFTAVTNRIGQKEQVIQSVKWNNHDITYHRKIGKSIQSESRSDIKILDSYDTLLSGVVILINKETWRKTGGFKDGFISVDRDFHRRCLDNNIKVGLMLGVYVYHWYRGDGDLTHLQRIAGSHPFPDFGKRTLI